ncbi:MAG: TIGR01212 family radical SAM protein [Eubacteriales bacterium]|nr:TIGR01212 family radical SAM protein [Eubacteriales bacterium]
MNQEKQLYRTYSSFLKEKYGEKVYKLPVNLPVSCPNRMDGRGCSFCAGVGTGFEASDAQISVYEQLQSTRIKVEKRYKAHKFIAYFQNYTNTFLPLNQLMDYMEEAAKVEDIVEIAISTRPDCIRDDFLEAFQNFQNRTGIEISIELGLQTVNYHTLKEVNRGHGLAEFLDAVLRIQPYHFPVCTHMILNLPGDTMEDVIESAKILSVLPVEMVKLHSLYIPKDCALYDDYVDGRITICSKEEYLNRLATFMIYLREDMVVERLFSRIPEEDSAFSNWQTSWWKLLDEWEALMKEKGYVQGSLCNYRNGSALTQWGI